MVLATDYPAGSIFLSMLWFFMFFIWIMLLFQVFGDLFRDHELSGFAKAIWILFVVIAPFLGVFVYLIARGPKMAERNAKAMSEMEQAQKEYIREAAGTATSTADELHRLADLRDRGVIDEAEFQSLKAKALA